MIIACSIGCYDGFFGPGTGTFLALAFTRFSGYGLLRATALSKILNLSSNIAALVFFIFIGRVNIKLGLIMGCFSMIGSYFGAHVGKFKGQLIIRPAIVIVCFLLVVKIMLDK